MDKTDFIRLHGIKQKYDGSKYVFMDGDDFLVRLNTIVEIGSPRLEIVWDKGCYKKYTDPQNVPAARKVATIVTSNAHGLGLNGCSFDHIIDKDSYERLMAAVAIIG